MSQLVQIMELQKIKLLVSEDHELKPLSPYAKAKVKIEKYILDKTPYILYNFKICDSFWILTKNEI